VPRVVSMCRISLEVPVGCRVLKCALDALLRHFGLPKTWYNLFFQPGISSIFRFGPPCNESQTERIAATHNVRIFLAFSLFPPTMAPLPIITLSFGGRVSSTTMMPPAPTDTPRCLSGSRYTRRSDTSRPPLYAVHSLLDAVFVRLPPQQAICPWSVHRNHRQKRTCNVNLIHSP
jgi:hypothetical protein